MLDKLEGIEKKYEELTVQLSDSALLADQQRYTKITKQHRDLEEIVTKYREYRTIDQGIKDSKEMLELETDEEMLELARTELAELEQRWIKVEEDLKVLLIPKDPNDEKNVILEIRAGTGGDEATLFAAEMFRMYDRYAESQRWKVEVLSTSESAIGG